MFGRVLVVLFSTVIFVFTNEVLSATCPKAPVTSGTNVKKGTVTMKEQWATGFKVGMTFLIPKDINGWKIILTFSKFVTNFQIWKANSKTSMGTRFDLSNMFWNRKLKKGTKFELSFIAGKSGNTPVVCSADLVWNGGTVTVPVTMLPTTSRPLSSSKPAPTRPSTTKPVTVLPPCPATKTKYNYDEVLRKSILFYEAQRSGRLPSNNRIPWRGDSALGDKGHDGEDLTGGWYDAGDYVKFGFPMAFSTTLLSWSLLEYKKAYSAAGQLRAMLDTVKWPLDYFIKAHVKTNVLYGQVGNGDIDHAYWGRPEDMTMSRPAYKIDRNKPGSDLAAETAAAMAAGSIAFRKVNPKYADKLLKHSKELYQFAEQYRGKYSDSISDAAKFYSSSNYNDELVWGAAWLYKATKEKHYLQKAEQYFTQYGMGNAGWAFSWDEKTAGVQMLLYELTGKSVYQTAIEKSLDAWLPGGSVSYTPKGLAWRIKWGSNRYAANTAFLALLASDKGLKSKDYTQFGRKQIHYMLGDSGRSYVVGFGNNPPTQPHHASSSCPDKPASCDWNDYNNPGPNPQILYGALVGGPDQNDFYQDKRNDYVMNEVACDYNAGFQSAVAALKSQEITSCR